MEYLMTYGWALLVIVIVIAVLMWINPFKAPEQCIFDQAGFTCSGPRLIANYTAAGATSATNNVLFADITNGNQKAIVINAIACVQGRTNPPAGWQDKAQFNVMEGGTTNKSLEYQGLFNIGSYTTDPPGQTKNTRCYKDWNGASLPSGGNSDFSGRLYVAYKFSDEPAEIPSKVVGANVVTKSQ